MKEKKIKIGILSQSFYPDIVATGELLYELAVKLARMDNILVNVITAQPSFVKKERLKKEEVCNGVKIKRLNISCFNKNELTGKILNSGSFFFNALFTIIFARKVDWLLIPTSPPLLPLVGTYAKFLRGQKYIYLMHDAYPEIAARLDYIKKNGFIYKVWDILSRISLKYADRIIVLSDDMKEGLLNWVKDLDEKRISVIHNWANEETVKIIPREENHFLDKFGIRDKFIVEYSGNMGRIHEFDTLLHAAKALKDQEDILFLFIGEGGKKPAIKKVVEDDELTNVSILPYQERDNLAYSLGMGDIHILTLQEGYRYLAAPSKLYGILAAGKPIIFIGEKKCYISKILENKECGYHVDIDDFEALKNLIIQLKNDKHAMVKLGNNSRKLFEDKYTLDKIANLYIELFSGNISLSGFVDYNDKPCNLNELVQEINTCISCSAQDEES